LSYRCSVRGAFAWALVALVGGGLLVAPIFHTCDADLRPSHGSDLDRVTVLDDRPDEVDADCVACAFLSHTRTAFTAGDAAVLPPAASSLLPPSADVTWTDDRFRDLSARSPPSSV
jgi:hypothetical protein